MISNKNFDIEQKWYQTFLWCRFLQEIGLGDAIAALPGASKDKQGKILVPMQDSRLQILADLERTKAIPGTSEESTKKMFKRNKTVFQKHFLKVY